MARLESSERQPSPENGNTRIANPAELMRDNPAALIVNKETYDRMTAHFAPDQFDLPQVVKVSTFSSEHGEVIKDFVVDGMTRTRFVYDHKDNPNVIPTTFRFRVRDVTASTLENTKIVPVEEKVEGQQALTMLQYLRAVVPPTIEHSQIAPDRISAHLINGWDNMVGPELARKYSALAALSLLGNQAINIATDEGLRRDLSRQQRLMAEETIEERVRLQEKLVEMGSVIRQTRIPRRELAQSAFMLVGTESPVIGGEIEARRQIFGYLHMPEVDRKLTAAFPNIGEREQMRDQLGQFISESFKRIGRAPNRQEAINVLGEALRNPQFNFNNALDVFTAENPVERYPQVQREVNRDRLVRVYMSSHSIQNLSAVESELVGRLGNVPNLSDAEIQGLTSEIKSAETILRRAVTFRTQITEQRDRYLEQGISERILDEAISQVQAAQEAVNNPNNVRSLRTNNGRLINTIDEATRKINNLITVRRIGGTVDEVTGDKLKEGYGPSVRRDIVELVFGEFKEITPRNQEEIQRRIEQLSSLDHDLFLRVRDSDMRLSTALQRQQELNRRRAAQQTPTTPPTTPPVEAKPTPPVRPTPKPSPVRPPVRLVQPPVRSPVQPPVESTPTALPPDAIDRTPVAPVDIVTSAPPSSVEPTVIPVQPIEPEDTVDIRQREEQRKQINREKYNRALSNFYRSLNDIDLAPQDITDTEREGTNVVVRHLGKLVYEWPDAARILREDYRRLLEENRRLLEELLDRQREDADRGTRTDR